MADKPAPNRDSAGRFTASKVSGRRHEVLTTDSLSGLSDEEYEKELAAARKVMEAQEKERADQAVFRVKVLDEEILTILTVAMMAKFTTVWADDRLKCCLMGTMWLRMETKTRGLWAQALRQRGLKIFKKSCKDNCNQSTVYDRVFRSARKRWKKKEVWNNKKRRKGSELGRPKGYGCRLKSNICHR